jgi:hypothetical protein
MLCSYVRIYWTDDGQSLDSSLCTVRTVVLVRSGTGIIIQYSNITIRTGRTVTSPADEDGRLVDKSKRNKQSRNVWMDGWCVVLSSEFWGISFSFLSLFRSSEPMYVFGLGLIHYNTTMAS